MTKAKVLLHNPNEASNSNSWKAVINSFLVVAALLCNIAAIVFGYLNAANVEGLFNNTINDLSAKYYNDVAPVGIIFGIIWPIIYLWTVAGGFYMVVSLCLPSTQSPVNTIPSLAPNTYFLFIIFGFASAVMWLFAFDQEHLAFSFTLLAVGAISFILALFMSIMLVEENPSKLDKTMLWVMRVLIHNGLGMIATWLTVASSIGLSIVMLYEDSPGQKTATLRGVFTVDQASSMVLTGVGVIMLVWFLLQNFVWQNYVAYVFTDYPVFVMAFSGIVAKLAPNAADHSLVIASIDLGLAVLLLLGRIGLSVYRFINHSGVKVSTVCADKARLTEKEK